MSTAPLDRTVEVVLRDGLVLRGWEAGSGEPLLLVHGFTGSVEAWGLSLLEELSLRYRVIAVDLPGHGASGGPRDPDRYSMSEILGDLRELLDHAGIDAATWIGYSMGGRVAFAASLEMPERVSRVVLESASPGLETASARAHRRNEDGRLALDLETGGIDRFVAQWLALPLFESQQRLSAEVRESARRRRLTGDALAWAACLRGLGTGSQPSYWDRLDFVMCPTLLLTGIDDPKFSALGARMAGSIPGAVHVVIDGAGHQVHLEAPDTWLSHVQSFLDKASAS